MEVRWHVLRTTLKIASVVTGKSKSASSGGRPGQSIPIRLVRAGRRKASTSCSCRARARSGTGTYSRTHLSGLTHEAPEAKFRATPITDAKPVKSVIESFREKYGVKNV